MNTFSSIFALLLFCEIFLANAIVVNLQNPAALLQANNEGIAYTSLSPAACAQDTPPAAKANFIPYRVPDTSTVLEFFGFGPRVPADDLLKALAALIRLVVKIIKTGHGDDDIEHGRFVGLWPCDDGSNITISVCDFDMEGKPINWKIMGDVYRGMGYFMKEELKSYQEMSFSVVVDEIGLVGTGGVKWNRVVERLKDVD